MAEPIVIANVVAGQGKRICSATDLPMTVDFRLEAWAAPTSGNSSRSIRCERYAELLR
jgi:hypothetical protein